MYNVYQIKSNQIVFKVGTFTMVYVVFKVGTFTMVYVVFKVGTFTMVYVVFKVGTFTMVYVVRITQGEHLKKRTKISLCSHTHKFMYYMYKINSLNMSIKCSDAAQIIVRPLAGTIH